MTLLERTCSLSTYRHKACISEKRKPALVHTSLASNTANITANTSVCPWEQDVMKNITSPYRLASQILKPPCLHLKHSSQCRKIFLKLRSNNDLCDLPNWGLI